jgi:short-subunit dehydrogenase
MAYHARGHEVHATARKAASLDGLPEGIARHALDVTDGASVAALAAEVLARAGRIDVLVNNAGYGLMGPAAEIPLGELRAQFETNVVGPLALVQAVVPSMAARRAGHVVNVGSVSGITATPFAGAYCASKAALHLLTESLRMELSVLGIAVTLVQPGGIASNFGNASREKGLGVLSGASLYEGIRESIEARARLSQEGATPADAFAAAVVPQLDRDDPPPVIRSGHGSTLMPLLRYALPTGLRDSFFKKRFGLVK